MRTLTILLLASIIFFFNSCTYKSGTSDPIEKIDLEYQFLSYLDEIGFSEQVVCDTYYFIIRAYDCLGCSQVLDEVLTYIEETESVAIIVLLENHKIAINKIEKEFKQLILSDREYVYFDFEFSNITPYYYYFSSECTLQSNGLVIDFFNDLNLRII